MCIPSDKKGYCKAYIILENTISYISSIPPNPLFQNVSRLCPPLQGVPMVASSPVRHESPMQMNPIEKRTEKSIN
jgi:hypothetical protein